MDLHSISSLIPYLLLFTALIYLTFHLFLIAGKGSTSSASTADKSKAVKRKKEWHSSETDDLLRENIQRNITQSIDAGTSLTKMLGEILNGYERF